jgi:hypothetical protein
MKKKILMHFFVWLCLIAAEITIYSQQWNSKTAEGFIVKYLVFISTFYFCYYLAIYRLKKAKGIFGLDNKRKLLLVLGMSSLHILFFFCLDFFVRKTMYGVSISSYILGRAWVITPILFGLVTLLENQNGKRLLKLVQQRHYDLENENKRLVIQNSLIVADNERLTSKNLQLIAQEAMLQKAKNSLEVDIVMLKGLSGAIQEEYRIKQAHMEELLRRLNNGNDLDGV